MGLGLSNAMVKRAERRAVTSVCREVEFSIEVAGCFEKVVEKN